MAVLSYNVAIPSNGTEATLFASSPTNANQISIRNTGTVTVLLGQLGGEIFPLNVGEFLGVAVGSDDTLMCKVQTNGTAGQVSVLAAG